MEIKLKTQVEITEYVNNGNQEWRDELCEGFGDNIEQKSEEVINIGFQNVIGVKGRLDADHKIFDVIKEKDLDICGIAEKMSTGQTELARKQW